jgi:hypothetical protein
VKEQIIKLAILFLTKFKQFPMNENKVDCPGEYKVEVMTDLEEILSSKSIAFESFEEYIQKAIASIENGLDIKRFYRPSHILDYYAVPYRRSAQVNQDNLLVSHRFYYHPQLQITPSAPTLHFDEELWDWVAEYPEMYLRILNSFTVDELLTYFYSKAPMGTVKLLEKHKGAFLHLLQTFDIDFILYMIDAAFGIATVNGSTPPKEPFDIQRDDVIELAHEIYANRKNIAFEEGLDHVF